MLSPGGGLPGTHGPASGVGSLGPKWAREGGLCGPPPLILISGPGGWGLKIGSGRRSMQPPSLYKYFGPGVGSPGPVDKKRGALFMTMAPRDGVPGA